MGKGAGTVGQTAEQAAAQKIGTQMLADWSARWAPVLKNFSASVLKAGEAGSPERVRATALHGVDNSMRASAGQEAITAGASRAGAVGSAKQKLAVTSLGDDTATMAGFKAVDADQAVDDATVQGLSSVVQAGQRSRDATLTGLNRQAAISGQEAAADAGLKLDQQIGRASLAANIIGTGAGLWMGQKKVNEQLPLPTTGDFARMDRGAGYG